MWEKFKKLPTLWKVVIIGVILAVALFIVDATTGSIRDIKNWAFDRNQAKVEEQNKALEEANAKLREENAKFMVEIEKLKVKEEATDALIDKVGGKLEENKEKTEQALAEVEKEIAETNIPVDAKVRCERLKVKLLAENVPGARDIDCEIK